MAGRHDNTGIIILAALLVGALLFTGALPKSVINLPSATLRLGGSATPMDSSGNIIVSGFARDNGWTFGGCSPEPCSAYGITSAFNTGDKAKQYRLNSLNCSFETGSGGVELVSPWNGTDPATEYAVNDTITGGNYMLLLTGNRTTFTSCTLNLTDLTPATPVQVEQPTTIPPSQGDLLGGIIASFQGTTSSSNASAQPASFWQQNFIWIIAALAALGAFMLFRKRR